MKVMSYEDYKRFEAECCNEDPVARLPVAALAFEVEAWCKLENLKPPSAEQLGQCIEFRFGYTTRHAPLVMKTWRTARADAVVATVAGKGSPAAVEAWIRDNVAAIYAASSEPSLQTISVVVSRTAAIAAELKLRGYL